MGLTGSGTGRIGLGTGIGLGNGFGNGYGWICLGGSTGLGVGLIGIGVGLIIGLPMIGFGFDGGIGFCVPGNGNLYLGGVIGNHGFGDGKPGDVILPVFTFHFKIAIMLFTFNYN